MPSASESKTMKGSHGGFGGPTLISRIEKQMDKRRKTLEGCVIRDGAQAPETLDWQRNKGRYEGLALALSILRSSSMNHEIERSNERIGFNE